MSWFLQFGSQGRLEGTFDAALASKAGSDGMRRASNKRLYLRELIMD
jgi:hypothetical protein